MGDAALAPAVTGRKLAAMDLLNILTRFPLIVGAAILLSACGLAETGATAAASGQSAAQQAAEARKTEEQVQQRLDEAAKQDAARRAAAERDTQ
jgi:hypothetical protein